MSLRKRLLASGLATALLVTGFLTSSAEPANAITGPNLVWSKTLAQKAIFRESSPMVTNLDGQNDVVVGNRDGNVYALHGNDGNSVGGWPRQTGNPIDSSPSAADTNFDGKQEVFIGSGYGGKRAGDLWSFTNEGATRWQYHPGDNDFPNLAMFSSPALGDVNGDGAADVSGFSLGLLGWSFSEGGSMNNGWPYYQDDTVFSSPALYDVDGDGRTDYIVGGDSSPGLPIDHRGGFMRAIRGDGSLIWAYPIDEMGRSSPAIGDIDGDGTPEIVFGTGDYWVRQPGGAHDSTKIFALDLQGHLKWSRDLGGYTPASIAMADVNGDGKLDVIESTWGGSNDGKVFVFDGNGNPVANWDNHSSGGGGVIGQIVTADFDADGGQDLVVPTGGGIFVYSGKTGAKLFGINEGSAAYQNSPWVGDIDGNGKLDIVLAGATPGDDNSASGLIQRWEMPTTAAQLGSKGWSQFRKDNRHTGSWTSTALNTNYCSANPGQGYTMVAGDGGVFGYCAAGFYGSMGGQKLNSPVVGIARRPQNDGYWEVAADGGIFAFGNAPFRQSMGGHKLNAPIVGMAATPTGDGYWMVASDGGIFAFGDAGFYGSMGGIKLNSPIVGIATSASGHGYWMVAADGGIFAFGDAPFRQSMGGHKLNAPIVGMSSTVSGGGYWLVASDGGVFAFGDAPFFGSMGGSHLNKPIVGMARANSGNGYRFVASDGGVFSYNASFLGSTGGIKLNQSVIGITS